MAQSLNGYLTELAKSYYLKNNSSEETKIKSSVSNLLASLDREMHLKIKRSFVFGSYERDTILPRSIDSKSDVDIMVVFNHTEFERTPETYRGWLHDFAIKHYQNRYGSPVTKAHPTVTITLNNIQYDLVPAKEQESIWGLAKILSIPKVGNTWRDTNPNDIKTKLTDANTRFSGIVRPIIRLLKAWNSTNGYPYDSYNLELAIIKMDFSYCDIQSGFFRAISALPISWDDTNDRKTKVQSLRSNIDKVKYYLNLNDAFSAKQWLHKSFPKV